MSGGRAGTGVAGGLLAGAPGTCPSSRHCPQSVSQLSMAPPPTTALPCASSWESTYPFSRQPPNCSPFSITGQSAFLWCTPNSDPGGPAGGCQAPGRRTPFEQPIRPLPHPLPLHPSPLQTQLQAPSPRLGQGWQPLPAPPTQRGSGARNPLGAVERAPAPARPWAGVSDRQWLRQQRLADQEGEKQGWRGRWRGAWGPRPSPLCLPRDPRPAVSLSLPPLPRKRRPQVA